MTLRKPNEEPLPQGLIPDQLTPLHIFHDAEVPILYTTQTVQRQRLLAYVTDINTEGVFTILVPVTEQNLRALESGFVTIRQALAASPAMLHWTNGTASAAWAYDLSTTPDDCLPNPQLHLFADREPILRTRAIGEKIKLGHIPASAVVFVAEATKLALKTVLDHVFSENPEGRPREEYRTMYDLPVQSFAFASFELSFAAPEDGLFSREEVKQAAEKLEKGLAWASGSDDTIAPFENREERDVILSAALLLTPPTSGPITEVRISGDWVGNREIVLSRQSRKRVRDALKQDDSEVPAFYVGRLGELDSDRHSFILRDIRFAHDQIQREEIKGDFPKELLDRMLDLRNEEAVLWGVERNGKFTASFVADRATFEKALVRIRENEQHQSEESS
jgi:hypothetical protein